jgi:hypothetical protein
MHTSIECDGIRDRYLPLFVNYNVSQPLGQLSPTGRSMAAFMNQDVQQLSHFGSRPASDVDEEFISCSADDSDFVSVAS